MQCPALAGGKGAAEMKAGTCLSFHSALHGQSHSLGDSSPLLSSRIPNEPQGKQSPSHTQNPQGQPDKTHVLTESPEVKRPEQTHVLTESPVVKQPGAQAQLSWLSSWTKEGPSGKAAWSSGSTLLAELLD